MIIHLPIKGTKPEDVKRLKEDIENQLRYGNGDVLYIPVEATVKEVNNETDN